MKEFDYDIAIIGSGIAGCVAAQTLVKNNFTNFVLIESQSEFGGSIRPIAKDSEICDYGLKEIPIIPGQEIATQEFCQIMASLLNIHFTESEQTLTTFARSGDNHDFQPFVGFGEKTPVERETLDYYIQNKILTPDASIHTWPANFLEGIQPKLITKSSVTKLDVENENISSLVINGDKKINVKRVIFAAHPLLLEQLIPVTVLPAKTRQRFSKTKFWTSVDLELKHPTPLTDRTDLHVLVGPGDEPRVVLGQFHTSSSGQQHSHWLTFVTDIEADEEITASALREMKKLIQKCYPTALEAKKEKVLVTAKSHGTLGGKNESDSAMTGVKNLHLASGMLEAVPNLIGTVLRANSAALSTLRQLQMNSDKAEPTPQVD